MGSTTPTVLPIEPIEGLSCLRRIHRAHTQYIVVAALYLSKSSMTFLEAY